MPLLALAITFATKQALFLSSEMKTMKPSSVLKAGLTLWPKAIEEYSDSTMFTIIISSIAIVMIIIHLIIVITKLDPTLVGMALRGLGLLRPEAS